MQTLPPTLARQAPSVLLYDWASTRWQEGQAETEAANRFAGIEVSFRLAVDAIPPLLRACRVADVDTDVGAARSYAWYRCLQAPLSSRATYTLLERGHVLDSMTLIRRHLETLVAVHYFHRRPGELKAHQLGTKRVNFSKMFNVVAPGLHSYYSNLLSDAAHSGPMVEGRWAMDYSDATPGVSHDDHWTSVVQNWAVPIALAYPVSMPQVLGLQVLAADVEAIHAGVVDKYTEVRDSHVGVNPRSASFYEAIGPIVGVVMK
jgi:hypothetical protein